jgi:outer membrane murein-binding lipoprotein Lpp
MKRIFTQDTTASLLGSFSALVDKLTAVAKREQEKATEISAKIVTLTAERQAAYDEANAANAAATKIATFIGGAA